MKLYSTIEVTYRQKQFILSRQTSFSNPAFDHYIFFIKDEFLLTFCPQEIEIKIFNDSDKQEVAISIGSKEFNEFQMAILISIITKYPARYIDSPKSIRVA